MANKVRGGLSATPIIGATSLVTVHCHTVPLCSCCPACSGGRIVAGVAEVEGRRVR